MKNVNILISLLLIVSIGLNGFLFFENRHENKDNFTMSPPANKETSGVNVCSDPYWADRIDLAEQQWLPVLSQLQDTLNNLIFHAADFSGDGIAKRIEEVKTPYQDYINNIFLPLWDEAFPAVYPETINETTMDGTAVNTPDFRTPRLQLPRIDNDFEIIQEAIKQANTDDIINAIQVLKKDVITLNASLNTFFPSVISWFSLKSK